MASWVERKEQSSEKSRCSGCASLSTALSIHWGNWVRDYKASLDLWRPGKCKCCSTWTLVGSFTVLATWYHASFHTVSFVCKALTGLLSALCQKWQVCRNTGKSNVPDIKLGQLFKKKEERIESDNKEEIRRSKENGECSLQLYHKEKPLNDVEMKSKWSVFLLAPIIRIQYLQWTRSFTLGRAGNWGTTRDVHQLRLLLLLVRLTMHKAVTVSVCGRERQR